MGIARSALVVGPAKCTRGGATFFTNENVEAKLTTTRAEIRPMAMSHGDARDTGRHVEMEVVPDGRWNSSVISAFWPYLNSTPGTSMGGASDTPLVVTGADAAVLTLVASYVKKMPSLLFSSKKSLIGSVGYRGVLGSGLDPDDDDAYLTYAASGGTFTDSGFTLSAIKTQPYTATWGSVDGFTDFMGEEGFSVDFEMQSKEIEIDGLGVVDERVTSVGIMVKCRPVGPTAAEILDALKFQGSGNGLGSSRQAGAAQLQITGADGVHYLTMAKATLVEAGYRFGSDVLRNGEIGFIETLNLSSGVQQPLATLAAS